MNDPDSGRLKKCGLFTVCAHPDSEMHNANLEIAQNISITILNSIGLCQEHYAGHSFCIRAAIMPAAADVANLAIKTLSSWQSAAFL